MEDLIVHTHVDLDACACVALAGVDSRHVHFLPAGIEQVPRICPCCDQRLSGRERILDHPLGEKGALETNGIRHAATVSMPEAQQADPRLLAEIDEQDSTGKVATPRFSLANIQRAVRRELGERGYRQTNLDRAIVETMGLVIRGLNRVYQDDQRARAEIGNYEIIEFPGFKLALLPGPVGPQTGVALAEQGIAGAVYQDGYNLGVTRYPDYNTPDLRLLAPHLPGWFIHSAGFLAAWGSRKSRATTKPPVGTPQNQCELVALLRRVYGERR